MDERIARRAVDTAAEYGVVASRYDQGMQGFVVALEDDSVDVAARRRLATILGGLVNAHVVDLVGVEAAFGEVSTAWLGKFADHHLRSAMCETLLEILALTPGEYCHVFARTPFTLVGLEDKDIYRESMRLWSEIAPLRENIAPFGAAGPTRREVDAAPPELCDLYPEVVEYGRVLGRRADTMAAKLREHMALLETRVAAVVASGPILDLMCERFLEEDLSFAWIEPAASGALDLGGYEERLLARARGDGDAWADA